MKASVLGKLDNTPLLTSKPLAPIYEAIANSAQAIDEGKVDDGRIEIEIFRDAALIENDVARPNRFTIKDNGIGFNKDNVESFFTTESRHKAKLGGKGNGRFLLLKSFQRVHVTSTFRDESEKLQRRSFAFERRDDQPEPPASPASGNLTGTTLDLTGLDEKLATALSRNLEWYADRIVGHFIPLFRRANCPKILIREAGGEPLSLNDFFASTMSPFARPRPFKVGEDEFTLTAYQVRSSEARDNALVFAAHGRAVKRERLGTHISGLDRKLRLGEGPSSVYVGFVEGERLNRLVQPDRLSFVSDDPGDEADADLFGNASGLSAIRTNALEEVRADLSEIIQAIQNDKEKAVQRYVSDVAPEYRRLLAIEKTRILEALPSNPRPKDIENVLGRVWIDRQTDLKAAGKKLLSEPSEPQTREAYVSQMEGYMDKFEDLDQAALAQYIIHRRVILNLLDKALKRDDETGRYQLEALIHRLIHPMRRTSEDVEFEEQNLWLLDDRLTYHSFLASDKELREAPQIETDSRMRPDLLAVFDSTMTFGEGRDPYVAFSVVEFKKPMRKDYSDRQPLSQVFDVVRDIRDGKFLDRSGRPIEGASRDAPAYCFVVCDVTDAVRRGAVDASGRLTPDQRGYFGWNGDLKIYFEIISYEKLIGDALRRNRYLFKKLGLPTDRVDD